MHRLPSRKHNSTNKLFRTQPDEKLTQLGAFFKTNINKALTNVFEIALDNGISVRDLSYLINVEALTLSIELLNKRSVKTKERKWRPSKSANTPPV